jgi:FMN phosphatase YigB (HAD superfamily)
MKLILDFDDVLFKTSELKERFFATLERLGVKEAREKYHFERKNDRPFSLRLFLRRICKEENIPEPDLLYREIMFICRDLKNEEMMSIIAEAGKENCYIVTNGDKEYQEDKITLSGIDSFVQEIVVVPGSKKEAVESVCRHFPEEDIIFVDDKELFFLDIDMEAVPNLKTILYDKGTVSKLKALIEKSV